MNQHKFVSYVRVSTAEQGQSGLGLEAQSQAVNDYVSHVSCDLIAQFVEVESGSRNDRPQLKAAIDLCKKQKATLIIAKLDRLARNVAFISTLMESGISFLAADNPHANKLMIHMLAAFAEHERDQIRARTKAALAAAKARGVVLGRYGREVLSRENRAEAMEHACTSSCYYRASRARINVRRDGPCNERASDSKCPRQTLAPSHCPPYVSSGFGY
jgi:DNA invertase Pin-like site-specific DNA recombinase